jgi:Protein of unknown function (DUF1549)/Protein of unknown function (DUF1553)
MIVRHSWAPGLVVLLIGTATAAEPARAGKISASSETSALAEKIDEQVARRWNEFGTKPAARADDAEFLRRVSLDLTGRIPSVEQVRTFLDDRRPDKRTRLIEQLLASPRYTSHFTNVWRALLLPEAGNNFQVRLQQGGFETWLKQQVARNVGYDQMVRELLTASLGGGPGPLALAGFLEAGPVPFYLAKEFKPETLAASTARTFLGVSVECAQCHNHPFASWKREQFWGFAAFFAGVKSQRLMDFLLPAGDDGDKHEMTLPGTEKVIQAKFLDGTEPTWKPGAGNRATLAAWVTAKENPYFARAAVNRLWAYFLGTGLVEPLDEMAGGTSRASNPEVLDLLAKEFVAHQFDVKFLIRAITATRAYQLTSAASDKSQDDPTMFARMPLRGLTGEQLFDSVAMATGYRDSGGGDDLITGLVGGNRSARSEFLTRFAPPERPTQTRTSILQALSLMNGKVTAAATTLEKSETLAAVVDAPFANDAQRVETLYLAALSRKPEKKELDRGVKFIRDAITEAKVKDAARGEALADLFWALLNSPEFILNH